MIAGHLLTAQKVNNLSERKEVNHRDLIFSRALRSVTVSEDLQLSHSVYSPGIWAAAGASCHSQFPSSLFNCKVVKNERKENTSLLKCGEIF